VAGQVLSVAQAAVGGSGRLALSTASLNFGADVVGERTAAQRILVSNTGSATLTLGSLSLSGAVSNYADTGSCFSGLALAAGASCYLDVTFDATAAGSQSAVLSVGVSGGTPASVALSGTGVSGASSDGPMPLWALFALGAALLGLGACRLSV
jgi:hypothetical protein